MGFVKINIWDQHEDWETSLKKWEVSFVLSIDPNNLSLFAKSSDS